MTIPLAATCVYTILHPDRLSEAAKLRGPSTFVVRQRMVTALDMFQSAKAVGEDVPVLFGDATNTRRLVYWARLTGINVGDEDTHYSVFPVRPLPPGHRPQELVLLSTGQRIAMGFIRPYAICRTPGFLQGKGAVVK
jgi:hypothetical protein